MKAAKPPAGRPLRRKKTPLPPPLDNRIIIENIKPQVDNGRFAAKRVVGDAVEISADIFTDGHDVLRAIAEVTTPEGESRAVELKHGVNDRWAGTVSVHHVGRWTFSVVAWRDPYLSWAADTRKKLAAGQDVSVEAQEAFGLIEHLGDLGADEPAIGSLMADIRVPGLAALAVIDLMLSEPMRAVMAKFGRRDGVCHSHTSLPLWVDREKAAFSSWYELFPRSLGQDAATHGTLRDVIRQLPYVRDLGFDVLYFPPIHPIGRTNRKGKNNSLVAMDQDPGSVYAIGSEAGGHEALHPELGSLADFDALLRAAGEHGLEIALDFAVQCSPDHPWIKEHPDWFDWRPDGTIRFAENPPKKYEDIVNLKIELPEVRQAILDVILLWVNRGVRIFRVDNPHTKPVPFWEWVIASVNKVNPEVLFLAEAFTRPKMMQQLAKVGFQQSYTYFTWRNTKAEIIEYITELGGDMSEYYRPNFFVNTPDINPYYLQTSGRAGFIVRATLAATLSGNWGLYSGFEICESRPVPGKEEYLDSEKYEFRPRDLQAPGNIANEIRALNRIRRDNKVLHDLRGTLFLNSWNDQILAYARMDSDLQECVFVMVNLDPHHVQTCQYEIPLWEFGLPDWGVMEAVDLMHGNTFNLHGKTHSISLDPTVNPVIVWRLMPQRKMTA